MEFDWKAACLDAERRCQEALADRIKWMARAEANTTYLEQIVRNLQDRIVRLEALAKVAERFYNADPKDDAEMQFIYVAYEEAMRDE